MVGNPLVFVPVLILFLTSLYLDLAELNHWPRP